MQLNTEIMNSQVLVEAIMDNCDDIISLKDLDCRFIACNKAFLGLLNVTKAQVIDKHISEVFLPVTSELIYKHFQETLITKEQSSFVFEVNGNNYNKIIRQTNIPIVENGVITKILSISKDISQEENLRQRYSEKSYQLNTLLEHIPLIVYLKDANLNFMMGSKLAKDFLKNGTDNTVPGVVIDLEHLFDISAEEDRQVIETKQALYAEKIVRSVDGTDHWYRICKAPILDEDELLGIIVIVKNIDIEKKREAQKEMFLATLTHDLKNPIQAQLMSLKLISEGQFGNLTPDQHEIVDMIIESANYMQDMLYTILRTYKFENGIIKLQKSSFDINSMMITCLNEITALAKDKNIRINFDNLALGEMLFADMHQLRRVIANLLNNAVNYAYSDSEVIVRISQKDKNLLFEFTNYSDPIEKDIQDKIFDKYVTGSGPYQKTGIGLGLYFAKKVIDAHNGTIAIDSEGCVTTFKFELPIHDAQADSCVDW